MLPFLKKYILQGIILVVLTGAATGWLKGLASSLLPGTEAPRCWIEEHWKAAIGSLPGQDSARFTVLLARLDGDTDGSQTAYLTGAFKGERGFRPLTTCRVVSLHGADQIEAERLAEQEADRLRVSRSADLILWGEVVERGALRVWITGPTMHADLKARPWTVDKGLLEPAFRERFAIALQAITFAALAPAQEQGESHAVADLLRPLLPRLRSLVADLPSGLTGQAKGELLFSAAWGFAIYGDQAGDSAVLEEAVAAYRGALAEWTRDRAPLDWATTQNNLGTALATLGARESGTARLEEAVAAYRAALAERTRDRAPLDWASTVEVAPNSAGRKTRRSAARSCASVRVTHSRQDPPAAHHQSHGRKRLYHRRPSHRRPQRRAARALKQHRQ